MDEEMFLCYKILGDQKYFSEKLLMLYTVPSAHAFSCHRLIHMLYLLFFKQMFTFL